jgi:prevent-host-death family protein
MSKIYSTYEAKAKFSEILRQVREGKTITISYHGEPVAEIRPIEKKQTLEERLLELEERGVLVPAPGTRKPIKPVAHVPGALQRFLEERHRE